jgi:hypothetical protein
VATEEEFEKRREALKTVAEYGGRGTWVTTVDGTAAGAQHLTRLFEVAARVDVSVLVAPWPWSDDTEPVTFRRIM